MYQYHFRLKRGAGIVVLALLYYVAARIGLGFSIAETNTSPVWPASGVALAGLLLFGWRIWPGIWLGSFASSLVDLYKTQPASPSALLWISVLIATGSTLMALAGIFLCSRWLGQRNGDYWRGPLFTKLDVFSFIALAFGICLISASVGSMTICSSGIALWTDFPLLWFTWWFGDATGILIVTPFLLAWSRVPRKAVPMHFWGEIALVFGLLILVCWLVFSSWNSHEGRALPLAFTLMAPLVWIALRCGPHATTTALLLISIFATWETASHVGPLVIGNENDSLLLMLWYLGIVATSTHALESDSTARRKAEAENQELNATLEERVKERTIELEKSSQRYQLAAANIPNGFVCLFDRDLRFSLADGNLLKLCGLSKEVVEGKTIREAFPAGLVKAIEPHCCAALAGSADLFEVPADGHNLLVTTLPMRGPQDNVVAGMLMGLNITAEKRAEAALRESERFAHATIDALSAHICVIDEAGTIRSVNQSWRAFAKANPPVPGNCAEGANYLAVCERAVGPCCEEAGPFAAGIRAVIAGERLEFSMEYPCDAPWARRWFVGRVTRFPQGPPYCFVIAHEDITERKLAELALRKSEQRFHVFMRYLPGVAFMKDREGRYVYINEQCEAYFQEKPADYLGTTIEEHVAADIADEIRKDDQQIFESGIPLLKVHDVMSPDGIHHWLVNRFPIVDDTGARTLLGAIALDITERIRAEQKVEVALKKEVILKRELHHRVKNSLQVVISLLFLQAAQIADPAAREVLRECQSRTRSIALIYALLCRSENMARIEFPDYVRQLTADLLVAYCVSPETVAIDILAEGVFMSVDTALPCGLIITELVSNSLKHAFPNGRKGEIKIQLRRVGCGTLALTVADNGIGLPGGLEVDKARTMGLTMVRDLVRQLDGTICVQGGQGTAVKISFPQDVPVCV